MKLSKEQVLALIDREGGDLHTTINPANKTVIVHTAPSINVETGEAECIVYGWVPLKVNTHVVTEYNGLKTMGANHEG